MRFLHVTERSGRYLAELREGEIPRPGEGEVLIRVAASGLNRADLSQIAGRYPPPPGESEILGLEVSGTAVASGEAVCALLAGGGHAEYVAAPRGQVFPRPAAVDPVAAAGLPEAFLTAFLTLVVEAGLGAGDAALVHAGASGVGLAAIQVAKCRGARVAATTRTEGKLAALERAGADLALHAPSQDVVREIEAHWGPNAVRAVLDPVGQATLAGDLAVLAPGGTIVFIATLSGARAELDVSALMKKRARLVGSTLRSRSREEKAALADRFRQELLPAFDRGALRVVVDGTFPPERAAEAFQRMRDNTSAGKLLLDWR
jgi:putative PIG3 family NAD(P)H quinone oxidoreductase